MKRLLIALRPSTGVIESPRFKCNSLALVESDVLGWYASPSTGV